jgi:hypothetical protein
MGSGGYSNCQRVRAGEAVISRPGYCNRPEQKDRTDGRVVEGIPLSNERLVSHLWRFSPIRHVILTHGLVLSLLLSRWPSLFALQLFHQRASLRPKLFLHLESHSIFRPSV